jgi:hypothetical protein
MINIGNPQPGPMGNSSPYGPGLMSTNSYTFHFRNYTSNPLYLSDGTGIDVKILPPLLNTNGTYRPDMRPEWGGRIVCIRANTTEVPAQVGTSIQYDQRTSSWDIIASPPPFTGKDLADWSIISKEFNVLIAGSPGIVSRFIKEYGSVYEYLKVTDFGTRFKNSVNYGIYNKTERLLYQVDDTAVDAFGVSDIITIPYGDNINVPIWTQQQANNKFFIEESRPFVRAYRYELVNVDERAYHGTMRERIYYWNSEFLNEDGFLYMPQFHVCMFDNYETAQQFISKYGTVEKYELELYKSEHYSAIQNYANELKIKFNREHKLVITGCALLVSFQVAWKLGELIIWLVKENAKTGSSRHKKPPDIAGKQSFISASFDSSFSLFDGIGSVFL